jgi:tetratricopeptide (TPR) repeat protein
MKRTALLGISLLLVLGLVVSAVPSFAQAPQPKLNTRPEYDGYMAAFNEKDPAKKAAAAEKFITDFKDSDPVAIANCYTMAIQGYTGAKNWAKVMEAADRAAAYAQATNTLKAFAWANAMVAAQNLNDVDKVVSYGEKVLTLNPNDVQTLLILATAIPTKLPTDAAAKTAALDKAEGYANKALTGIQGLMAQADAALKQQLTAAEGSLYATKGLVAYNKQDYNKSIQEYGEAVKRTPKDDVSHYYLASNYQMLQSGTVTQYKAALDEENKAKAARADQPTIDELSAKTKGLEDEVRNFRDKAIDEFATAAAIGGPVAAQAKSALEKMWITKNDSTAGMDEFINSKKQ